MPYIGNITQDFNVNNAMLDTDSVTSIKIVDGTIEGADIAANLDLSDSQKIRFGAGNDLQIYHNGSHSYIDDAGTGNLYIRSSQLVLQNAAGDEDLAILTSNGAVKLYFDDSKKLETTSTGVTVTGALATTSLSATGGITGTGGNFILGDSSGTSDDRIKLGAGGDLHIYHDGSNSYVNDLGTGNLLLVTNGAELQLLGAGGGDFMVKAVSNGAVELYYDNSKKLETAADRVSIYGNLVIADGSGFLMQNGFTNASVQMRNAGGSTDGNFEFLTRDSGGSLVEALEITKDSHIRIVNDSKQLRLGAGDDLRLEHDGSHSYISNYTGNLHFRTVSNETSAIFKPNGAVELYHDNVKTFATKAGGNTLYGTDASGNVSLGRFYFKQESGTVRALYDPNAQKFQHYDNTYATFGNGDDLKIYHDGSHSIINNITGSFQVQDAGTEKFRVSGTGTFFKDDITLSNDNDKINIGASNDLQIYHDGSNSYVADNGAGELRLASNNGNGVRITKSDAESLANFTNDGRCELYHDNILSLATTTEGIEIQKTASGQTARLKIEATNGGQAGIELRTALVGTNRAARIDMYNQNTLQWSIFNDYQQDGTNDFAVRHGTELAIRALPDEKVELYYDNSRKFFTSSSGAQVTGSLQLTEHLNLNNGKELKLGNSSQMTIWHSGSDFNMYNNTGQIIIANASGTGVGEGEIVFKTGSNNTRWRMTSGGDFIPAVNNSFAIGSTSNRIAILYSQAAVNTSDKTLKNTITTSDLGLDFINKLKPVSYKWNQYEGEIADTRTHYGLIAQDVEEVITSSGKTLNDFGGVDKPDEGCMGLAYSQFISPLVKAVQELSAKVETLETKVAALEAA